MNGATLAIRLDNCPKSRQFPAELFFRVQPWVI